jgi:hypothetical protein
LRVEKVVFLAEPFKQNQVLKHRSLQ